MDKSKQKIVLSVRDFAILYNLANMEITRAENATTPSRYWRLSEKEQKEKEEEAMKELKQNPMYQDLLRIRESLGNLNIEVETPIVEINALTEELQD